MQCGLTFGRASRSVRGCVPVWRRTMQHSHARELQMKNAVHETDVDAQSAPLSAPLSTPLSTPVRAPLSAPLSVRMSAPMSAGVILDVSWTIEEKTVPRGRFLRLLVCDFGTDVLRSRYVLDMPAGFLLRILERNLRIKRTDTTMSGRRIGSWAARTRPRCSWRRFASTAWKPTPCCCRNPDAAIAPCHPSSSLITPLLR